jgi:RNA polymerase sigma-70 factor, ECF subfamily
MNERDYLAERFEENRTHLRAVAYRMLGSVGEVDDAVQEAWLRLSRADTAGIDNLGGWLTTVVARVCLDMLRSRKSRREEPFTPDEQDPVATGAHRRSSVLSERSESKDPEHEALLADSVGLALLVVLDRLEPAERLAFVLHDMFAVPFDEIAPIVGRSADAARQLASRARRRVRGAAAPATDAAQNRELVSAFLAASRDGDFDRLLTVLSPDAVLRADATSVRVAAAYQERGGPILAPEVRGAAQVANAFKGRATAALPAFIDGEPGAVWAVRGQVRSAFVFTITGGKITGIDLVMDDEHLGALEIEIG